MLVVEVAPEHVEEFLAVDHEVWTLGEAHTDGFDHIPFLSKEVWLDGEMTERAHHWSRCPARGGSSTLLDEVGSRRGHQIDS